MILLLIAFRGNGRVWNIKSFTNVLLNVLFLLRNKKIAAINFHAIYWRVLENVKLIENLRKCENNWESQKMWEFK